MAVVISVITMVSGVIVATASSAPELAPFGWFLAAIGAVSAVVNVVIARSTR